MFMPHGDFGGLLSSLTSCFGERGGALLWRNVMRGTLGEESGLLPVGLQEATNRKAIIENDNNVGDNAWQCSLNSPLLPVVIKFLVDESLS